MKILVDTSVIVAASVAKHPHFSRAFPVLENVGKGQWSGVISAHSLAEAYAVLTTLPVKPRIHATEALQILEENVARVFESVVLNPKQYFGLLGRCAKEGIIGGAVYDALILECARKTECDFIYTFNVADFERIAPDLSEKIVAP